MDSVYGEDVAVTDLADETQLDAFIEAANQLPPPQILGMVIMDTDDVEETTKGLRFMGQRFVPDAYIFRQLIYRNVGTRDDRRGLPKGLDLLAAMGSERAYQILDEMGETAYAELPRSRWPRSSDWVVGPERRGVDRDAVQRLALHLPAAAGGARRGLPGLHAVDGLAGQAAQHRAGQLGRAQARHHPLRQAGLRRDWAAARRRRRRCRPRATSSRCPSSTPAWRR